MAPVVAAVARRFHSSIELLHVVAQQPHYYPVPEAAPPGARERNKEERQAGVKCLEEFAARFVGIPVEPVLLEGDVAQKIASLAKEDRIDLIMLPTHGYGPFRRLLLGSITTKVLHDAACPVWTEAHMESAELRGDLKWDRFLCAVDETAHDAGLLKWALQFANEQQAELSVIHTVSVIPSRSGESGLCDLLLGVAESNLEQLQKEAGTDLDIHVRLGPVGYTVAETAMMEHVDLILVGRAEARRGPGGFFSHAYSIIREAPCPVISLPGCVTHENGQFA